MPQRSVVYIGFHFLINIRLNKRELEKFMSMINNIANNFHKNIFNNSEQNNNHAIQFPNEHKDINALHKAVFQRDYQKAQYLASTGQFNVNHKYKNLPSPLFLLAKFPSFPSKSKEYLNTMNIFMNAGGNPALPYYEDSSKQLKTAFQAAMEKLNDIFIITILKHPQTPSICSLQIPSHYLEHMPEKEQIFIKNLQKSALLSNKHRDINALHKAVLRCDYEKAQYLASTGHFNVNHKYKNLPSPLFLLAQFPSFPSKLKEYLNTINTFMDVGGNPELPYYEDSSKQLKTALQIAMEKFNNRFIITVLKHPQTPSTCSLQIPNNYLKHMSEKEQIFIKNLQKKAQILKGKVPKQ